VTLAYPPVKRVGSPVPGTADGYGGQAFAGTLGSLIGVAVLSLPAILAVELTSSVPAAVRLPVIALCAAGYGFVVAWGGARWAAVVAARGLPELVQMAARSKL
jgi:ABC-2 type transport system permease protein